MRKRPRALVRAIVVLGFHCLIQSCAVAPKYQKPAVEVPAQYKEIGWTAAQPADDRFRGKWWEMYRNPELNALEERVEVSNQNIAAAFASFLQARALLKEAEAQYLPTLSLAPNFTTQGGISSSSSSASSFKGTFSQYSLPLDASWVPDLWGRIKSTVDQNLANAQVSAADLQNQRLTQQAELAIDYFQLRGQDSMKQLLDATVVAYRQSLKLTRALYGTGIGTDEAVAQAETQLETAEAQDVGLDIARAQYEHAIALLTGQPASSFTLAPKSLNTSPPEIPIGVPSSLLERRPDIAAAERAMAAANAQIGIGIAAYYPSLTLSGSAGVGSNTFEGLLSLPSFIWSVGASVSQYIFDGGARAATVEQYKAFFGQSVATYRQAVLTAFQQVEDAMAGTRILNKQIAQQRSAIQASTRFLKIASKRFKLGIDPYVNVLTAQISLLTNQQAEIGLRTQQMTTSVQLIEDLGGGWERPLPKSIGN